MSTTVWFSILTARHPLPRWGIRFKHGTLTAAFGQRRIYLEF
jgi:hypothetical protein